MLLTLKGTLQTRESILITVKTLVRCSQNTSQHQPPSWMEISFLRFEKQRLRELGKFLKWHIVLDWD